MLNGADLIFLKRSIELSRETWSDRRAIVVDKHSMSMDFMASLTSLPADIRIGITKAAMKGTLVQKVFETLLTERMYWCHPLTEEEMRIMTRSTIDLYLTEGAAAQNPGLDHMVNEHLVAPIRRMLLLHIPEKTWEMWRLRTDGNNEYALISDGDYRVAVFEDYVLNAGEQPGEVLYADKNSLC